MQNFVKFVIWKDEHLAFYSHPRITNFGHLIESSVYLFSVYERSFLGDLALFKHNTHIKNQENSQIKVCALIILSIKQYF
jgi:hypothetical protein